MEEGTIYCLFFAGVLFNYIIKLRLENGGHTVGRSNAREGVVCGISAYLLYQILVQPEIPIHLRITGVILGLSSLLIGAFFFLQGRWRQKAQL